MNPLFKKNLYTILAYTMLVLAFGLFSLQTYQDFSHLFNIDISYFTIASFLSGMLFSFLVVFILRLVSRLNLFSIYHDKIINMIRTILYVLIVIMFLFWSSLLMISIIFITPDIEISSMLYKFFAKTILVSLLYSSSVNLFFFSLAIRIPKKEKK